MVRAVVGSTAELTEARYLLFLMEVDTSCTSSPKMPTDALWKLFTLALISSGTSFGIVETDEMKTFLEQTMGPVPTREALFDQHGFRIEQMMLSDVRNLVLYTRILLPMLTRGLLFLPPRL